MIDNAGTRRFVLTTNLRHPSQPWMRFPQELVEEIINYLSFHDREDQPSLKKLFIGCEIVEKPQQKTHHRIYSYHKREPEVVAG